MPKRLGRAAVYSVLIWLIGFIWGSLVLMTPALKSIHAMPYISTNPAISFPILTVWIVLAYFTARNCLKAATSPASEGRKVGIMFAIVNFALDLLVLVFLLKAGFSYFLSLTVWIGYLILLVVPWMTGHSLEAKKKGA